MKNKIYQGLIALTLFAALMLPTAQAEHRMAFSGNVPFDFFIKDKHLPAGEYQVKADPNTNLVLIQSTDARSAAFAPTIRVQAHKSPDVGTLVFHRYGDQYFLSTIWTVGTDTGRELLKSRAERELARSMTDSATTIVAARSSKK